MKKAGKTQKIWFFKMLNSIQSPSAFERASGPLKSHTCSILINRSKWAISLEVEGLDPIAEFLVMEED